MLHDVQPSEILGAQGEWLASGRVDNLVSCYAAISTLCDIEISDLEATPLVCLFDHEEVGSVSSAGASGNFLSDAIKIFPVSLMGGATYIKTLSSIFPGVLLVPTGGIKPNEVKEYLDNGAICVGLGGVVINETLINQGERKMIFNASMEILKQAKL